MTEGPYETTEGHGPLLVEVVSSLPPEFMCKNRTPADGPESCQVQVEVIIGTGDDQSCIAGLSYPQAVVGYSFDEGILTFLFIKPSNCSSSAIQLQMNIIVININLPFYLSHTQIML